MAIWFQQPTLPELAAITRDTLMASLGIEFLEIGDDFLRGRMPVDHRTAQPAGLLHGGASVALAETLGSAAAGHCVDPARYYCVGIEVNANHVRGVRQGYVYGKASPLHLGGSTQIWDIRLRNEQQQLVCVSRLTVAVLAWP